MDANELVKEFGNIIWEKLYKDREVFSLEQVSIIKALFRASGLGDPEIDYDIVQMVDTVVDNPYVDDSLLDEMKSAYKEYSDIHKYYLDIYYDMKSCGARL